MTEDEKNQIKESLLNDADIGAAIESYQKAKKARGVKCTAKVASVSAVGVSCTGTALKVSMSIMATTLAGLLLKGMGVSYATVAENGKMTAIKGDEHTSKQRAGLALWPFMACSSSKKLHMGKTAALEFTASVTKIDQLA